MKIDEKSPKLRDKSPTSTPESFETKVFPESENGKSAPPPMGSLLRGQKRPRRVRVKPSEVTSLKTHNIQDNFWRRAGFLIGSSNHRRRIVDKLLCDYSLTASYGTPSGAAKTAISGQYFDLQCLER